MVDVPGAPPAQPDVAKAAVAAFISTQAKPQSAAPIPSSTPAIEPLLQAQIREAAVHPAWLALEAAWRSLRLIFAARERRAATRLFLCEVARDRCADVMESETFSDALRDAPPMRAILVMGAFSRTAKDLAQLDRVALVAERLATPAIVSLDADFLGATPQDVAAMDDPAALLDAPGYAAWRGLRGRVESRSLFAAWNDFALRPGAGEAPVLWGEPGVVVAAQILRSLSKTGWPTEIFGAESALGGLDVVETTMGGRVVAIPLRAAPDLTRARDLAEEGFACLMARPDRDQVWLTRAPSLHALGRTPEADRKAMETLNSLPFGFVSAYFEDLLQAHGARLASHEATAAALQRLLNDVLLTTGEGGAARVELVEDNGERRFEATIRLGRTVMGGFDFSFDFAV
jgi:predicted component of type VI protein secretion system